MRANFNHIQELPFVKKLSKKVTKLNDENKILRRVILQLGRTLDVPEPAHEYVHIKTEPGVADINVSQDVIELESTDGEHIHYKIEEDESDCLDGCVDSFECDDCCVNGHNCFESLGLSRNEASVYMDLGQPDRCEDCFQKWSNSDDASDYLKQVKVNNEDALNKYTYTDGGETVLLTSSIPSVCAGASTVVTNNVTIIDEEDESGEEEEEEEVEESGEEEDEESGEEDEEVEESGEEEEEVEESGEEEEEVEESGEEEEEVEESGEEEEEVEESGEEEEEEEVEESGEEEEEEIEVEEEEEVYEITIKGTKYFTTNEKNGDIYSIDSDGDPCDVVGKFVNGRQQFD